VNLPFHHLSSSRELSLRECPLITDDSVIDILIACPNLKLLNISSCIRVRGYAFLDLVSETDSISDDVKCETYRPRNLPKSCLEGIGKRVNRLFMSDLPLLSIEAIYAIIDFFNTQLKELDFTRSHQLNNKHLGRLFIHSFA